jgi:hypothetical protein
MNKLKKRQQKDLKLGIIIKRFKLNSRVLMLWDIITEELMKLHKKQQKPKHRRKLIVQENKPSKKEKIRMKKLPKRLRISDLNIYKHQLTIEQKQLMKLGFLQWAHMF